MTQLPFFVYGTLRSNQPNAHLWQGCVAQVETAVFPNATLYSLGTYPMLIATGDAPVYGELLHIEAAAYANILSRFDGLEGYEPHQPQQSPYRREKRQVLTENGRLQNAWVYLGQPRIVQNKTTIPSGDWLTFAAQQRENMKAWWQTVSTVAGLH